MERDLIRLESLKLAVSRTTDQTEIMARSKEYEDYISGKEKMVDNAAPTSANLTAGKDGGRPAKG